MAILTRRPCLYCRSAAPKAILGPGGAALRLVARMQMVVVSSRYWADQFTVKYCPMCGRRL